MELGEEQQEAVQAIKDFLNNSKELAFLLQGPGGTGKTTVSKAVCMYLDEIGKDYVLTAPTHKAKLVLSKASDMPAITLHKLFNLKPEIEIWNFDARDLTFKKDNKVVLPKNGLIICDEGSMINDTMYDFLISMCIKHDCKVLFMADKAQLSPVQSNSTYSKIFNTPLQFTLTKIYRQENDNALAPILDKLRKEPIDTITSKKGITGSIYCTNNIKQFLISARDAFIKAIKDKDILETKITAFTNDRVAAYNEVLRAFLFGNDSPEYVTHEFLTAYDNIDNGFLEIYNSMDYIIDSAEKTIKNIPHFKELPGWDLRLYDSSNDFYNDIFILSRDIEPEVITDLADLLDNYRKKALMAKRYGNRRQSGMLWGQFFDILQSFTTPVDIINSEGYCMKRKTFDYGYACTTHKLQGTTLNTIYVDMNNINRVKDPKARRQLQYVALSRTKTDAYIFQ